MNKLKPLQVDKYRKAILDLYLKIREDEKVVLANFCKEHQISSSLGTLLIRLGVMEKSLSKAGYFIWKIPGNPNFFGIAEKALRLQNEQQTLLKRKSLERLKDKNSHPTIGRIQQISPSLQKEKVKKEDLFIKEEIESIDKSEEQEIEKAFLNRQIKDSNNKINYHNTFNLELTKLEGRVLVLLLESMEKSPELEIYSSFLDRISYKIFENLM